MRAEDLVGGIAQQRAVDAIEIAMFSKMVDQQDRHQALRRHVDRVYIGNKSILFPLLSMTETGSYATRPGRVVGLFPADRSGDETSIICWSDGLESKVYNFPWRDNSEKTAGGNCFMSIPGVVKSPDFSAVVSACEEFMEAVSSEDCDDVFSNFEQVIFERSLMAVYGNKVFDYINDVI